jgi:hypothetical protein
MLVNNWSGIVDEKLITLLERWIERRLVRMNAKHAFLPKEGSRCIFKKRYNSLGQAIFDIEIKEGLEYGRSTAPHQLDDVDEFGHLFITKMTNLEQTIIIANVDPLDEFIDKNYWKYFLKDLGFGKAIHYEKVLMEAMYKMQLLAAEIGLVKNMKESNQGLVEGWENIAEEIGVSIPTAVKWAEDNELHLPVVKIKGKIYLVKGKMHEFWERLLDTHQYSGLKKKARGSNIECECGNFN